MDKIQKDGFVTHRTDHDLDRLDPTLPFSSDVVRCPYSTDPTQETCARSCTLYGPDPAA